MAERLAVAADTAGAWGYRTGAAGSAEATALAALALASPDKEPGLVAGALQWLARLQLDNGVVPTSAAVPAAHWPTPLALLAWLRCAPADASAYTRRVEKAVDWLLEARGRSIERDPEIHDHDTTLIGWSWVEGTHSWIEPTAYAILGLRAAGKAEHPRVREGVRLILDRALPDGGWNYGNRRVLEHVLRPFPATTGVALAALAGEPRDERVDAGLAYLRGEMPRVRAPLSLGWGVIGLRAWAAPPSESRVWLEESARRLLQRPAGALYDALLLLAGADRCPLTATLEGGSDA